MFSLSSLGLFNRKKDQKLLKEWEDYTLLPDESDPISYLVRIEKGNYFGVVYRYKLVQIREEGPLFDKHAKINFTYDIIKQPEDIIVDKFDFEQHIGKILHSIMSNIAASGEYEKEQVRLERVNENRNVDFTEFNIE